MFTYNNHLNLLKQFGEPNEGRGSPVIRGFNTHLAYDCSAGVPIYTGRRMHLKSIIGELCWFLRGSLRSDYLNHHNIKIWDEWTDNDGVVGCVYPKTMRKGVEKCIKLLKTNPYSRRIYFSTSDDVLLDALQVYNPRALPPCHGLHVQFYVDNNNVLHLHQTQRSADMFLGLPFNITSYALLLHIMAIKTGFKPGWLYINTLDTHIYQNHIQSVTETLKNNKDFKSFPVGIVDCALTEYDLEHFDIQGYNEKDYPKVTAPVSV